MGTRDITEVFEGVETKAADKMPATARSDVRISDQIICTGGIEYRLGDVKRINFNKPIVLNSEAVCPKFKADMEKTAPNSKIAVELAMDNTSHHVLVVISGKIAGWRIKTEALSKQELNYNAKVYNYLVNYLGMTPSLVKGIGELIEQLLMHMEQHGNLMDIGDDYSIEEIYRIIVDTCKKLNGNNGIKADQHFVRIPSRLQLEDILRPLYGKTYSKKDDVLLELKKQEVLIIDKHRKYQAGTGKSGSEYKIRIRQNVLDGADFEDGGDNNE